MPATAPLAPQYDYLANVLSAADKVSAASLTGAQVNIVAALNSLIADLGIAIRSDNQLMDQIVHLWALGPDVLGVIGSAAGWQPKTSAQAATTAALPANTYAAGVLTATANGALPAQDGVALVVGQSLLVQNEVTAANNGIYLVTQVGTVGTPYILTRRADASTAASLGYAFIYISSGAINGGINFLCTAPPATLIMGTTAITFLPFGKAQGTAAVLSLGAGGSGSSTAPAARLAFGFPLIMDPFLTSASLGAARISLGDVLGEINTIAGLKALATTDLNGGQFVRGYYAAGDGGGGIYYWNATDGSSDNGGTIIQPNSGGVGRWNLLNQTGVYSVKAFGAKVDGATDDTTAAQACINYVQSINGGTVYIPNGIMRVSTTLLVTRSNVIIRGAGGDTYHDGGTGVTPGTRIQWIGGASPVVQIKTLSGVTNSVITGNGVQALAIDGNSAATYGLDIFTIRCGQFDDLYIANVITASYHTNCGVTGVYAAEACDVQYCRFSRCTWRNIDSAGVQGASGFILDGSSNANTSLNLFELCTGQTWAAAANSCGYVLADADNNVFLRCGVTRINTVGAGVQVNGALSDANHFFNCTIGGANGILIKGTASGYSGNSVRCSFWGMDGANNTLPPTYDAGCTASFHLDTGANYRHRAIQGASSDGAGVQGAMTNIGNASHIFDNGSNNHVLLSAAGAAPMWGVNFDANGNLRFLRLTGNGFVNIGSGADYMVGTMRITYGTAPPVAGTWARGDKCLQTQPAVGSPKAWQCTVAGTPGTWVSEGNL